MMRKGNNNLTGGEIGIPTVPGNVVTKENDKVAQRILNQNAPAPGWDWKDMSLLKKVLVVVAILGVVAIGIYFSFMANTRAEMINSISPNTPATNTAPSGSDPISSQAVIAPTATPEKDKSGMTRAEIARENIPNVETDWKSNCVSRNSQGGCEQFEFAYTGPECAHWSENQTVCYEYTTAGKLGKKTTPPATTASVAKTTTVPPQTQQNNNQQNLPELSATTSEWFPIGKPKEFTEYGTKIKIVVPEKPDGNIGISLADLNIWNSGKELLAQIRFKNTETGEEFDGQIIPQLKAGAGGGTWGSFIKDKNIDPQKILWQPKFGIRTR